MEMFIKYITNYALKRKPILNELRMEKSAMKKKIHYKIVFVKYTIILIIKKNY